MVRLVRLLIRCLVNYQRVTVVSHSSQMSFAMLSNDMVATRTYRHGLTFDPNEYRVAKEVSGKEMLISLSELFDCNGFLAPEHLYSSLSKIGLLLQLPHHSCC